jgi:hypothetical protein
MNEHRWLKAREQLFRNRGVQTFGVFHTEGEANAGYVANQRTHGRHFVRPTVGKVDQLDGTNQIKLTKQSSPDGQHHHFIPLSWVDHVDQHVHLNKSGADVTAHWQHGQH